jgi:hypothetical protein
VWIEESQVLAVPPPHAPLAPLAPQPEHVLAVVRRFDPQLSAQLPAAVPQPAPLVQVTVQHSLPPPAAQVVGVAEHVQLLHTSPVPLQ